MGSVMKNVLVVNSKVIQQDFTDSVLTERQVEDGWRLVEDHVFPGMIEQEDGSFELPLQSPTAKDVNIERDRRVLKGSSFIPVGYSVSVKVAGDPLTKSNLQNLAFASSLRVSQGDLTSITQYRDEDNVVHSLTPPQVIDLWSKGASFVEDIFHASWVLKSEPDNIPADYVEDYHWP
jgi:hypothetical protein